MKRLSAVWLFLSLSCAAFAQSSLQWGIEIYPNVSNRRLLPQNDVSQDQIDQLEGLEVAKFSYSAGLTASWRRERIGFKTGLNFVESGYQTRRVEVDPRDEVPEGADDQRTAYQSFFLEVPAELQFFQSFNKKNDFLFMLGFSAAFNISTRQRTTFFLGDTEEAEVETLDSGDYTGLHFSFLTGLGYQHSFSDNLAVLLQPNFQFWLTGLLSDPNARINRSLYSVGLRLGVKF